MFEANAYAPPKAAVDPVEVVSPDAPEIPTFKLYTPGQTMLATFLGTPLAGLYLVSVNQRRQGRAGDATRSIIFGVIAAAVIFAVSFAVPGLGRAIPFAAMFGVRAYAQKETPVEEHQRAGGPIESGWRAAGIGLLALLLVLVVAAAVGVAIGMSDEYE